MREFLSVLLSALLGALPVTMPYSAFPYMELSTEKDGKIVFRADRVVNSSISLTGYRLVRGFGRNRHRWYLSILGRIGDHPHSQEMEFTSWRGLKLTIPRDSFNPKEDTVYYRDQDESYPIVLGTRESWKKHLKTTRQQEYDDV